MATDDQYALLYNKKLLPVTQLREQFLLYLLKQVRSNSQDFFGTDTSLTGAAAAVVASGNNAINIAHAAAIHATNGLGVTIKVAANDSRLQNIRIPPDAAVLFNVGLEQNDVETGVEVNPRTAAFEYVSLVEQIGRVLNPTSVAVVASTLVINVNDLVESGLDHTGRQVRVWLKSTDNGGPGPQTADATVAIQTIAIAFTTPNNTITVPNLMGQAAPSTTATDYMVQLIGPTVKQVATENLQNTAGCFFLGNVTSVATGNPITTIDTSGQQVVTLTPAQADLAIANAVSILDQFSRAGIEAGGCNFSGSSGLNATFASGTAVIGGQLFAVAGATLALVDNTTNWVFVNNLGVLATLTTFPTLVNDILLWQINTSGGVVGTSVDARRNLTRMNSRRQVTVGPHNCDFTTIEGAVSWVNQNQATAELTPFEILIQGVIAMTQTVSLTRPTTFRGVQKDTPGTPVSGLTAPAGGAPMFSVGSANAINVSFNDLSLTLAANAGSTVVQSLSVGVDGWMFNNCEIVGNSTVTSPINIGSSVLCSGWIFQGCTFTGNLGVGINAYISLGNDTFGFMIDKCRFLGELTNLQVGGINCFGTASDHRITNCEFNLGGVGYFGSATVDNVAISGCRFYNTRGPAVLAASSGFTIVENCLFKSCCANGSGGTFSPDAVVLINDSTPGTGTAIIRNNRINGWAVGNAIASTVGIGTGSDHRIENNVIQCLSSQATPTVGISMSLETGCLIAGNDIDMNFGSGTGRSGATAISALGAQTRISGNKIKNTGNGGTGANPAVSINNNDCLFNGNSFVNSFGILLSLIGANCVVSGNSFCAQLNNSAEIAIQVSSNGNTITGNVVHANGGAGGSVGIAVSGSVSNNKINGNFVESSATTSTAIGQSGHANIVPINQNQAAANVSIAASTTSVGGAGTGGHALLPPHTFGNHLPVTAALAAAVTVTGGAIQSVIRLFFQGGTTLDIINTTASPTSTDLTQDLSAFTLGGDAAVFDVALGYKNTSTTLQSLIAVGASNYYGYVVG